MTRNPILLCVLFAASFASLLSAQNEPSGTAGAGASSGKPANVEAKIAGSASASDQASEQQGVVSSGGLDELKGKLAEQRRQIERLSEALEAQRKLLESSLKAASEATSAHAPELPRLGEVASASGTIPLPAAAPMTAPAIAL